MHSKKLLSVCFALILACACLFGICTLNVGAAATTWKVDGTQYATLQAAIDDAATKTWAAGDELVIEITATDAQTVKAVDGILFGAKTIFRADNTRLPITIKGGTLACDASITGEIACANSYNFSNLAFDINTKEIFFFAGSGEVSLTVVAFEGDSKCHFYADAPSGKCFEGWTAAHADAAKVDGLVNTSLTFDGTSYYSKVDGVDNTSTWQNFELYSSLVAIVGGVTDIESTSAVKSTDLRCELVIKGGAELNDVSARDVLAMSSVRELRLTMKDSDTSIDTLFGMGKAKPNGYTSADGTTETAKQELRIEYPPCDMIYNLSDGKILDRTFFLCCTIMKGDLTINMKDITHATHSTVTFWGKLDGNANICLDNVTVADTYWGFRSGEVTGNLTTVFKGGTNAKTLHSSLGVTCGGNVTTDWMDCFSTTNTVYLLGQGCKVAGNLTSNIYKGFSLPSGKNVLGTGHTESASTIGGDIVVNVYGGKFGGSIYPVARNTTVLGSVTANIEFAADDTESFIPGGVLMGYNKTYVKGDVTMNIKKCHIGGNVSALYGPSTACDGNASVVIDGATVDGKYIGVTEGTLAGNLTTTVKSGSFGGEFFGAGSKLGTGADAAVPGDIKGSVTTVIEGGTFKGDVFGGSSVTGNLHAVSLEIKGGEFEKNVYATCGGAVTETTAPATAESAILKVSGGTFNGTVAASFQLGNYTTTVSGENSATMEGTLNIKGFANLKPTAIPSGKTLTLNQVDVWNTTINYVEVAEALKASVKFTTANGVKGTVIEGTKDGVYTITGTETPKAPEPEPTPDESTTTTTAAPTTTTKKPTTTTKAPTTTTAAAGAVTTTAAAAADDAGFPWVIVIVAAAVVVVAAVLLIVFRGKIFKKK